MSNDDGRLLTQTEARREAKRINELGEAPSGLIAIAVPYPQASWGGAEKGWTVTYTPAPRGGRNA